MIDITTSSHRWVPDWAVQGRERHTMPLPLQLTFHLTTHQRDLPKGDILSFHQSDPVAAARILEHLQPERVFRQAQVLLSSDRGVTVVPTARIERIEVRTHPLPHWQYPFGAGLLGIEEISEETFRDLQRQELAPRVVQVLGQPMFVPPTEMALMVRSTSGRHTYLQIHRSPDLPTNPGPIAVDMPLFLSRIFDRLPLFGRTRDKAGYFLLNPANVASFTLSPALPGPLAGVWHLEEERD